MSIKLRLSAAVFGLIAVGAVTVPFPLYVSSSLADLGEPRPTPVKSVMADTQPSVPQAGGVAKSDFISQQSIGARHVSQRADDGERGDRIEVADTTVEPDGRDLDMLGSDIDLTGVERLRLRIWGMNDSSGEFSVEQGSISMPGVGRVSLVGKTSKSLEALLSTRMTAITRRKVDVSVEIVRYQPFYATGHVSRAGAHDWRPGLTLIQAVALAGGVVRNSEGSDSPDRSILVHQARSQLQFALVQYERLKAEKDGSTGVNPSARLRQLNEFSAASSEAALSGFLDRQNQVLEEQKASLNSQISSLDREMAAAQKEVEAAEVQSRVAAQQVLITRQLLDGLNKLKAQGNIGNARYLGQQNDALTAEVRLAESRAHVERARARVASIDRQMTILRQDRRATLNDRIETLEREIAQHELTLTHLSGNREPDAAPVVEFNIARKSHSGTSTVAATLFTEIQPGDVVIVSNSTERSTRGSQTASTPSANNDSTATALLRAEQLIASSTVSSSSASSAGQRNTRTVR